VWRFIERKGDDFVVLYSSTYIPIFTVSGDRKLGENNELNSPLSSPQSSMLDVVYFSCEPPAFCCRPQSAKKIQEREKNTRRAG